MKKSNKDLTESFIFPDIPEVVYPVYLYSESGRLYNFKAVIYPTPKSIKRYTRRKQLTHRSLQAKIFDAFINVGYFEPLTVWREFPIIIKNSLRLPGQTGSYIMCDYYFPSLRLAVELDSEYHIPEKDKIRDRFLESIYGITTFRITDLQKPEVQKTKFRELAKFMRERGNIEPVKFNFMTFDR